MRKRDNQKGKRGLYSELLALRKSELEAVSEYFLASAFCKEVYPELSDTFVRFSREHSENLFLIEWMRVHFSIDSPCGVKLTFSGMPSGNDRAMIEALARRERECKLGYERLYIGEVDSESEEEIKKVLRAFDERLSILENIMRA